MRKLANEEMEYNLRILKFARIAIGMRMEME
jgi:hypothetical protein